MTSMNSRSFRAVFQRFIVGIFVQNENAVGYTNPSRDARREMRGSAFSVLPRTVQITVNPRGNLGEVIVPLPAQPPILTATPPRLKW